jgi:hypothetical protein
MSTAPIQAIRELDKTDLLQVVDYCSEHSKLPQSQLFGNLDVSAGRSGYAADNAASGIVW